jgi:hypothetical protein
MIRDSASSEEQLLRDYTISNTSFPGNAGNGVCGSA